MTNDSLGLPFWEGFLATSLRREDGFSHLTLIPDPSVALVCSCCGEPCEQIHDQVYREIRDMPMLGDAVRLSVLVSRVSCSTCGPKIQRINWLARHARVTRRLADFVGLWCEKLPVAHVCKLTGLHWETVRNIERARLEQILGSLPEPEPIRLVMDEFALFKGHRYATVVLDADTRRVLWVSEGRSRESIRPFFTWLGERRCQAIQAVAMDMSTAFDLEVRSQCPNARVIYDLFHVIAKYGREVIDRVRVDEANRLKHDRPMRQVVKRSRWLLLRNPNSIPSTHQSQLNQLLAANQALMTTYLMGASLKQLWRTNDAWEWRRAWRSWMGMAQQSGVEPLIRFARKLRLYWRGILARVSWPMHTGQLEGINNRIKLMKRMAYGYRDSQFFFMKIKAAFPGNP